MSTAPPRRPVAPPAVRRPAPDHRPMDPRIRQRRLAVRRDQGRQRLRILAAFASVFTLAGASALLLHSPWLSVSAVRIDGASGARATALVRSLAPLRHRPMVDVDAATVDRLTARLAWVDRVSSHRSWPSTLVVDVTVRTPVGQLQDGTGWAQVDATGRVVDVSAGRVPALMALGGLPPPGPPGSHLGAEAVSALQVAAVVPGPLRPQVVAVSPEDGGGVALLLASGAVVDLGPPADLPAKMTALSTVLASVDMTGVRRVDLRVPDQPALTRQ